MYNEQNPSTHTKQKQPSEQHPQQNQPSKKNIKHQISEQMEQRTQQQQQKYYNQYCKLHLANTVLTSQLRQLQSEKNQLVVKLEKLQSRAKELSDGNSGQVDEKKRRIRRAASEIARHYKCSVDGCHKSYGSEGSLNQHIKLKHPEVYQHMGLMYNPSIVKESRDEEYS